MRRMTTGGMRLDDLSAAERRSAGLADDVLALRTRYVPDRAGTTGHGAAKQAGFQKGDILIAVDGKSKRLTESQWMTTFVNSRKVGDRIHIGVLRDGKRLKLELPMQ
jgi:S1-C subfamily serine protease